MTLFWKNDRKQLVFDPDIFDMFLEILIHSKIPAESASTRIPSSGYSCSTRIERQTMQKDKKQTENKDDKK